MDKFLIDYLLSGKAWVLVGSGLSIERGYPSWKRLAELAIELARVEGNQSNISEAESAYKRGDYAFVFEKIKEWIGIERLLQHLQLHLRASKNDKKIYELIAKWPIPVYLTTNYDNEIHDSLVELGEAYNTFNNSEEHFGHLIPDLNGAIVKLHGDLLGEKGLVLTTSQYKQIANGDEWKYWRTKLTSIFQMNRVVVIGHSLTDTHIKHVLEAAKLGAGVQQPICWIAPDIDPRLSQEYLEKYRIRIVSYDNRDGGHRNLLRLIESISDFIPQRLTVNIQKQIEAASQSPLEINAAAPGYFVFNKLASEANFEDKRTEVVVATIQAALPKLAQIGEFSLISALEIVGWPKQIPLADEFLNSIKEKLISQDILSSTGNNFKVNNKAKDLTATNRASFEHMRDRFKKSLLLRLKRAYPSIDDKNADVVVSDIEASLVGFFRENGLTLVTTLFSSVQTTRSNPIPSSILRYIRDASSRYNDSLLRQAFMTITLDAFVRTTSAEREYLGRISQGFFAFHALGAFGDAAVERLNETKRTVWLIDSSAQIPSLALASPVCATYRSCFTRLRSIGIRFFTTAKLFNETFEHLWFANDIMRKHKDEIHLLIAASTGQPPFRKSNVFLEGFLRWVEAGNPFEWENYLFAISDSRELVKEKLEAVLGKLGIEVIEFSDWPGFNQLDYSSAEENKTKIVKILSETRHQLPATRDFDQMSDPEEKARPESEALVIVKGERDGHYNILGDGHEKSPSWFISDTSMLNIIEQGIRITWQTEAFLRFSAIVFPSIDSDASEMAFQTILLSLAQSGVSLLDDNTIENAFGGIIDQTAINMAEQREIFEQLLSKKYGTSPELLLSSTPRMYRPLVAVQVANELASAATEKERIAIEITRKVIERAEKAEGDLKKVAKYKKKIQVKEAQKLKKSRKNKLKKKK